MDNKELLSLFDSAGKSIISMFSELDDLEKKYGKQANWVSKKRENVEMMATFYEGVRQKLAFYEDVLKLTHANYTTIEILYWKDKMQINHEQLAALMGYENTAKWKSLDTLDKKLEALKNGIIPKDNT